MQLNIKTDEAYALAREIADIKGVSLTAAVTDALRRELGMLKARPRKRPTEDEILALARAVTRGETDIPDHGELLYDKDGLPK